MEFRRVLFRSRPLGALCSAAALGGPQPGGLSWPLCSPRAVAPVAPPRRQACGSPPSLDHPVQSLLPLPLEGLLPQAGCAHPATACRGEWRRPCWREARRAARVCRARWLSGRPSCLTGAASESEDPGHAEVGPDVVAVLARSGRSAPTACLWSQGGGGEEPGWHVLAAAAALVSLPAQDAGSAQERALRGRAAPSPAAAADLQSPRAGGAPAAGVLLLGGAAALPLGRAHPEGARRRLLEGTERVQIGRASCRERVSSPV